MDVSIKEKKNLTKCLNSAAKLPLVDSSMFITFVLVPKILNFLNLHNERKELSPKFIERTQH